MSVRIEPSEGRVSQSDRLTKAELSWLLTQEARAAAKTLRQGVAALSQHPPAPPVAAAPIIQHTEDAGDTTAIVTSSLDALDDAMRMLASLNEGMGARGVRTRVDLAALTCEVAPSARVRIAPGTGTEVYGEESDLRRMVQIMARTAGAFRMGNEDGAPEVSIEGHGDEVRLSVALGPETGVADRTERTWLNRMALRYGGRLEFKGGHQSLILPAEGALEKKEVEALRQELAAAQQQGEAYARELAAVFASDDTVEQVSVAPSSLPPPTGALASMTALAAIVSAQVKSVLASLDDKHSGAATAAALHQRIDGCQQRLRDVVAELDRVSSIVTDDLPQRLDIGQFINAVSDDLQDFAHATQVSLLTSLNTPPEPILVPAADLRSLVSLLLVHAITASPRGSSVSISADIGPKRLKIVIDDAGAAVPAGARLALLWGRIDPAAVGRPRGIQLLAASALVDRLDGSLDLADSPSGGTRTIARIPTS